MSGSLQTYDDFEEDDSDASDSDASFEDFDEQHIKTIKVN
jgi:hypothetical protein